jgi:hypothetical protein
MFETLSPLELLGGAVILGVTIGLPALQMILAHSVGYIAKTYDFYSDAIAGKESTKFAEELK